MTTYTMSWLGYHTKEDPNAYATHGEPFGDGAIEHEYRRTFEAESVDEAKSKARRIFDESNNDSGVFSVCDDNGVVFTEQTS